ncbi:MAG: hypothetical protein ACFFA5_05980 [Promethearchaeota archaeon]
MAEKKIPEFSMLKWPRGTHLTPVIPIPPPKLIDDPIPLDDLPDIYNLIREIKKDQLVELINLRIKFQQQVQEAQLNFNRQKFEIQKEYNTEVSRILEQERTRTER